MKGIFVVWDHVITYFGDLFKIWVKLAILANFLVGVSY